jgi:hypothetical protein
MSTEQILNKLTAMLDVSDRVLTQSYKLNAHLFGEQPAATIDKRPSHGTGFMNEIATLLDILGDNLDRVYMVLQDTNEQLVPERTPVASNPAPKPSRPPLHKADMSELLTDKDMALSAVELGIAPNTRPSKPSPGAF